MLTTPTMVYLITQVRKLISLSSWLLIKIADTVYILAFSVIMLNTDAHNPSIKKKMQKSVSTLLTRTNAHVYIIYSTHVAAHTYFHDER